MKRLLPLILRWASWFRFGFLWRHFVSGPLSLLGMAERNLSWLWNPSVLGIVLTCLRRNLRYPLHWDLPHMHHLILPSPKEKDSRHPNAENLQKQKVEFLFRMDMHKEECMVTQATAGSRECPCKWGSSATAQGRGRPLRAPILSLTMWIQVILTHAVLLHYCCCPLLCLGSLLDLCPNRLYKALGEDLEALLVQVYGLRTL